MRNKLTPVFWFSLISGFNHSVNSLGILLLSPLLLKSEFFVVLSSWSLSSKIQLLGLLLSLKPVTEAMTAFVLSRLNRSRSISSLCGCLLVILLSLSVFAISIMQGKLWLLFVAQGLLGVGSAVIYLIETAVTEVTAPHERTRAFNSLEWAIGMGMLLGPIIGSWVSHVGGGWHPDYPYLIFVVMGVAVFSVSACFVPMNLILPVEVASAPAGLSWLDYAAWFFFMLGWHGYFHWFPALMLHQFHYTTMQLGHVFTYLGLMYVLCQFGVVRWFTHYAWYHRVLFVAMPAVAICIALLPFVDSIPELYALLFVYMLAISFLLPFWKSYLSQRYRQDPGKMFGTMTVITTVCSILASLSGGLLASYSLSLMFVACGLLLLVALLCLKLGFVPAES